MPWPFGDICGNAADDDCNGVKDDSALATALAPPSTALINGEQVVHRFAITTSTAQTRTDMFQVNAMQKGVSVGMYRLEINGADRTKELDIIQADTKADLKTGYSTGEYFQVQFIWKTGEWFAPESHTDVFTVKATVTGASSGDSVRHWFQWQAVICSTDTGTLLTM